MKKYMISVLTGKINSLGEGSYKYLPKNLNFVIKIPEQYSESTKHFFTKEYI